MFIIKISDFSLQSLYDTEQALSQQLTSDLRLAELTQALEKEIGVSGTAGSLHPDVLEVSCDLMPTADVDQLSIEIEKER